MRRALLRRDAADREASISKIHVGPHQDKGCAADTSVWIASGTYIFGTLPANAANGLIAQTMRAGTREIEGVAMWRR